MTLLLFWAGKQSQGGGRNGAKSGIRGAGGHRILLSGTLHIGQYLPVRVRLLTLAVTRLSVAKVALTTMLGGKRRNDGQHYRDMGAGPLY